jgi:membrane protein required for colicin V production
MLAMTDMNLTQFNWVDWIILLIFFFAFLSGVARGFVREIVSLATLVAAFIIAVTFSEQLSTFFTHTPTGQEAISSLSSSTGINAEKPVSFFSIAASFAIIFIGVTIVGALIGYFLNLAVSMMGPLNFGNRLMGGVFGLCKGFIINLVIIFVLQLTSVGIQPWWTSSYFVNSFQPAVQWLGNHVSPALDNITIKLNEAWQNVSDKL